MSNISVYQILISLVAIMFIGFQFVRFIKRESGQTFFKFVIIECIWATILILTVFPSVSRSASKFLGFGENLNTLIFIGFVVVFIIIFRLLHTIEKLERSLSELVRKESLEKIKTKE